MSAGLKPIVQTFVPEADLSSSQWSPMKLDPASSSQAMVPCANDDKAVGILINAPVGPKDIAEVSVAQGAKAKCSGTVTAGDYLRAAGSGAMKTVTSGFADALAMNSGVANDIIPVIIAHIWLG